MRRTIALAMAAAVTSLWIDPAASATIPVTNSPYLGELGSGDTIFSDGGYVSEGRAQSHNVAYYGARTQDPNSTPPDPCAAPSHISNCFRYDFGVTEPGMLRVAVDASNRGDCFGFELTSPDGRSRTFPTSCPALGGTSYDPLWGAHAYTMERQISVAANDLGVWQLRVITGDVYDWAFRFRMGLDVEVPSEPAVLAPNLQPWLPLEFGFTAPANPDSGSAMDHENPSGPGLESCTGSEKEQTNRCLRFSSGLTNVGRGPLFIDFDTTAHTGTQYVFHSDATPGVYTDNLDSGAYSTYHAGTAEWHEEHGHRHINDMVLYELFEVTDRHKGKMDPKGKRLSGTTPGEKEGYCSIDQGFGDWTSFTQEGFLSAHSQLGMFCDTALALSTGWGDMYRWQRQGQYLPYDAVVEDDGSMRPGLYLVRVTIDPLGRIVESDERDNAGYALIQVIEEAGATRVAICERGLGPHPWSPHAEPLDEPFWWTVLRSSQAPRPGDCPQF